MKKGITKDVLEFMKSTDTGKMSDNSFILEFFKIYDGEYFGFHFKQFFITGTNIGSITRARRKIIADYGIGERTNADTEQSYIDEYARKNKIHVI